MDRTEITGLRGLPPRSRLVSLVIAILMLQVGTLGLLGWAFDVPRFYQPWPGSDPLRPVAALCLLLLGAALACLAQEHPRRQVSRALALGPVLIGSMGLLVRSAMLDVVIPWDIPGGIWPAIASSLGIVLAGIAIIALETTSETIPSPFIVGTAGVTLIALNLAVLFVMFLGVSSGERSSRLVGASFPTAVTLLLLGVHLVRQAWSAVWSPDSPPLWMPIGMGLASLTAVLFLWSALVAAQRDEGVDVMGSAARASRLVILERFEGIRSALRHVALLATRQEPRATWDRQVGEIVRGSPGLEAVAWLPDDGTAPHLIARNPDAFPDLLRQVDRLVPALRTWHAEAAMGSLDSLQVHPLPESPSLFAASLPGCDVSSCGGSYIGIFRPASLLQDVVNDTLYGFHRALWWSGKEVVVPGEPADGAMQWMDRSEIHFGGLHWELQVWPTTEQLRHVRSELPQAVLVLGLLLSCLLPATAQLARTVVAQGRTTEEARLSLMLGGAMDRTWSWELPRAPGTTPLLRTTSATHEAREGPWTLLVHPDDRRRVESLLSAHLAGRNAVFESEYRVANGRHGWSTRIDRGRVTERGPYGAPLQMLGVTGDVTGRRKADHDRETSERRFRAVFDSAPQFQSLLDQECRILETNRSVRGFLGHVLDESAMQGRVLWEMPWWSSEQTRLRVQYACSQASAGRTFREELEVEDIDGRVVHLELSLFPILDVEGGVSQLLVEGQDVSLRRRAEQELRAVETLTTMGRIAARVAHEINNPLAGIQNSLLLMRDAVPKDHPHYSFVGAIQREIARIAQVTRQLYETYRPESEGSQRAGVRVVISDAVALLEQVNRQSRVRIEAQMGSCPNAIPLPESVLRQSIYNLVQNAVEASPQGGVVTVRALVVDDHFILRVGDQGPGIPPEMRERIFDAFVSTKDRTTPTGGMGIGLSLVRRSVEALGGTIFIESPATGGAEFVVRIPLNPKRSGVFL